MEKDEVPALAERMIAAVKGFVAKTEAALDTRLKAIEQKIADLRLAKGDKGDKGDTVKGEKGDPGKDADLELVRQLVERVVAALPKPQDGKDGKDGVGVKGEKGDPGKDVDLELVRRLVEQAVAALPKPQDGKDGKDGVAVKGEKGDPGKDVDPVVLRGVVDNSVRLAVSLLPRPLDGKDGESIKGDKGDKGDPGKDASLDVINASVHRAVSALPVPKDGADGKDGVGIKGEKGDAGKNADAELVRLVVAEVLPAMVERAQDMLAERLQAAVSAVVSALPAPAAGKDGKDGASVHPDTVALLVKKEVEQAVAGLPKPKDGKDGKDGAAGDPGRDATALSVLPDVDEARSYPAGTYARYHGGEIRAERRTDPIKDGDLLAAGWTVARDGVAAVVVMQGEDPRCIEVVTMLTSGTKAVASFTIPMLVYQKVWKEGIAYKNGDVATWGGSSWHSNVDDNKDKPGTSPSWQMMVKEGAKGKDGTPPMTVEKRPVTIR